MGIIDYEEARKIRDFNSGWLNKTIGEGRHSVIEWAEQEAEKHHRAHIIKYSGVWFDGVDLLTYKDCCLKKRAKPPEGKTLKIGWQR